ncbi:MAG: S1C family serine protease [Bacteroides sp.]|nr:S1C family serine protease [Prevotella sp.]MCM1408343.1 S1C family serine protease [Treponema brennaborense]MCM1470425.1 S1C family serine protease [Bacteroides sp.]
MIYSGNGIRRHYMLFAPFILCFIFFCGSCASEKQAVLSPDEYGSRQSLESEIKEIEKIVPNNPVYALFRAMLLRENVPNDNAAQEITDFCAQAVKKCLAESLSAEQENIFRAWQLYESLSFAGTQYVQDAAYSAEDLYARAMLPLLSELKQPENETSGKIFQYIAGTVTVWVDLGLKVEKGMGYPERVIGSGFFIDPRGYIVTNHHVIQHLVDPTYKGFSRLYIKLAEDSDTRIPAKVIGWDPTLDLALIKTEIDAPYVFALGSSNSLNIGERIYAIGSPAGLERTLTSGIVSAIDRKLLSVASVMQIDAAINAGNSGGPIIDQMGNVQAVVFAGMLRADGLNFAIPVEYLKRNLAALYRGGKVEHSWIGAYGRTKKGDADQSGQREDAGVEILYTMTSGSAWYAGIMPGDTIVSIANTQIKTLEQMQNALLSVSPGMLVPIECVGASGEKTTRIVYLDARPDAPGKTFYRHETAANACLPLFGMKLNSVSENRKKFAVAAVVNGSIADESGFSENDPVTLGRTKILEDENLFYAELYTKKRKSGYLDINVAMIAPLDSPYFF